MPSSYQKMMYISSIHLSFRSTDNKCPIQINWEPKHIRDTREDLVMIVYVQHKINFRFYFFLIINTQTKEIQIKWVTNFYLNIHFYMWL